MQLSRACDVNGAQQTIRAGYRDRLRQDVLEALNWQIHRACARPILTINQNSTDCP